MVGWREGEGIGLTTDLDNRPPVLEFSHDGGWVLSICNPLIGSCDKAAFRFYLTPPPYGTPLEFKFVDPSPSK